MHKKLETNFLVKCRFKNDIKSSLNLKEVERTSTRFNLVTTNGLF